MSNSAIKLFGKTIPLPLYHHKDLSSSSSSSSDEDCPDSDSTSSLENKTAKEQQQHQELNKERSAKETTNDKQENSTADDSKQKETTTSSDNNEKPKTSTAETEKESSNNKNGEQSETSDSQEKPLKKPDKILPCPRCNSMDTKFCYFNNYNVNQPRHFCKNCQRYWTAGGTMRNVPVGAGRRKNKNTSASNYRHIMVSEAFKLAQVGNSTTNSTVLNFGSSADSTLYESVASVLNLSDQTSNNLRNGYKPNRTEHRIHGSENGDDRLSGSSITVSTPSEKVISNCNMQETVPYASGQVACFPGPQWPCPWNSTPYCHSGFPVSFYPAPPYWGCSVPNPWNLASLNPCATPSSNPGSALGKHSREGNIILNSNNVEDGSRESDCSERNALVPKTLRIDHLNEAAESSIWTTLGIKSEKSNFNGGGLFQGFQSKNIEERNYINADKSSVLQANPAALSRSLKFQEST
ncbi:hypothetical protein JCGZ_15619 [Jatropha curcas]|uniref:Dof-type domain-containing protein n=1 Tax=Jatropha curcas TaxID=180498 RepID=A0A067KYL1_JATCU|nr:cyclic dof factor 1 [Jatropha curcas]KDP41212.1 hypothetical protein JCGZ_15619 [Jatropha curcas]